MQNSEDAWDEVVFTAVMLAEDECVSQFFGTWENVVRDEKDEISSRRIRRAALRNEHPTTLRDRGVVRHGLLGPSQLLQAALHPVDFTQSIPPGVRLRIAGSHPTTDCPA